MNFEADGINKNHWADIFKFGTARLNLLVNFLAFDDIALIVALMTFFEKVLQA